MTRVQANAALWADTAIVITTDEGGGYFDSGPIQSIDFFGDGPRIPLIVVSPYAKRSFIDHTYQDHASILKFIRRNWRLPPLSYRSRDNLPNPDRDDDRRSERDDRPAIGEGAVPHPAPWAPEPGGKGDRATGGHAQRRSSISG